MRKRVAARLWLAVLLGALAFPSHAIAARKAFVVGVSAYASLPQLQTPRRDADAMKSFLSNLGFTVTELIDPRQSSFAAAWTRFTESIGEGDIVAFYFAGHGVQIDSVNHLLLKDTSGMEAGATPLLKSAINFHELMEAVEQRQPLASLYILDACRDNPFGGMPKLTRLGELHGLAKIESVYGAFVMYSAGPDESALDSLPGERGSGNSLYTRHLLALMGDADARIVEVAKKVQIAVEEEARLKAGYRQRPAYFDGILGHLYFADQSNPFRSGRPAELANNEQIIRLSRERQWGPNCESLPPPRIKVMSEPQYGRIISRFAKSEAKASFGNKKCDGTVQRGIELYYRIDDAYLNSDKIDRFQIDVHYSVDQGRTRVYAFEVDIPKKTSAYSVLRSR
jgi:hypothetical protein